MEQSRIRWYSSPSRTMPPGLPPTIEIIMANSGENTMGSQRYHEMACQ